MRSKEHPTIHLPVRPTFDCPVCGKTVVMYCRRSEWGYWYNDTTSQIEKRMTYLCSGECAKKFEEMKIRKRAEEIAKTKTYAVLKLVDSEGITYKEAAQRIGISSNSVKNWCENMRNFCFREIEWLEKHEVGA